MGNTASTVNLQEKRHHSHLLPRDRQHSITSQLFPGRNTRNAQDDSPVSAAAAAAAPGKWKRRLSLNHAPAVVSTPSPLFKPDYSMNESSNASIAGLGSNYTTSSQEDLNKLQAVDSSRKNTLSSIESNSASSKPAPPLLNPTNVSADDSSQLRDHLAGLTIHSEGLSRNVSNAVSRSSYDSSATPNPATNHVSSPRVYPFPLSPGPASPTVEPTRHEAELLPTRSEVDGEAENDRYRDQFPSYLHRPSIVALKRSLVEGRIGSKLHVQPSNGDTTNASSSTAGSLKNYILDDNNRILLPSQLIDDDRQDSGRTDSIDIPGRGHAATATIGSNRDTTALSDDQDVSLSPGSPVSQLDLSEGFLEDNDVLLNNAVLESAIRKDMKRKRQEKKRPEDQEKSFSSSVESAEPSAMSGVKKLKPLTPNEQERQRQVGEDYKNFLPSFQPIRTGATPKLFQVSRNGGRIDSFELGTVEHCESIGDDHRTVSGGSNAPNGGGKTTSMHANVEEEEEEEEAAGAGYSEDDLVNVVLKWRDCIVDPKTCKISVISSDISAVLSLQSSKKIPMEYETTEKSWFVPNLKLPPGVYKLQFLINGELRHSNFLPTATDSFGNFVNWFEVLPGYYEIEPLRDVPVDSMDYGSDLGVSMKESVNGGSDFTITAPIPRPPLLSQATSSSYRSSKYIERSTTPYSDYTGILSRSNSARPLLNQKKSSSYDFFAPLPPKKYEYSTDIPELFKVNDEEDHDHDIPEDPPSYSSLLKGSETEQPSFHCRVQDCNQDRLFSDLQQHDRIDAQAAEEFFLQKYPVPDLPIYLNSSYLNKVFNQLQKDNNAGETKAVVNPVIPHVNLNHLLTSSIREEIISVGCTTRYEGKFITHVVYAPCYYENTNRKEELV